MQRGIWMTFGLPGRAREGSFTKGLRSWRFAVRSQLHIKELEARLKTAVADAHNAQRVTDGSGGACCVCGAAT